MFVCPPRSVPRHETFAQRYAEDDVCYAAMYSAHCPYAESNSGVLREYENIAVPRGKIRLAGDADYRGEVFLAEGHGSVRIDCWTMSSVRIAIHADAPDRLVLNQNYFRGWKAVCRREQGPAARQTAQRNDEGLVSLPVEPGDVEVEFYYLPDSFLVGSLVSGLTLFGCLGLIVAAGRGGRMTDVLRPLAAAAAWRKRWSRSRGAVFLVWAVVLNLPLLLCRPGALAGTTPLVRSLAINLVLLVVPGLPWTRVLVVRGWLGRESWAAVVGLSCAAWVLCVAIAHVVGYAPSARMIWYAMAVVTNAGLICLAAARVPGERPAQVPGLNVRRLTGLLLFAAAYMAYFFGATRIVPDMEDHDYETQGTAYGLLTHLKPMLLTDRHTTYYFAHPPLLHACVAGSFLAWGELESLKPYDEAWQRVHAAGLGELNRPPVEQFQRLPRSGWLVHDGQTADPLATRHRATGVEGTDYLVDPPLPQYGRRIPVEDLEVQLLYDRYRHEPLLLPTRTPNLFFAALTVALLGQWVLRITGRGWLALAVAAAYGSSPEVFVRSCYGGYFAISQFALVEMLLAVEFWTSVRSRAAWRNALAAGGFAALACHKLVLLPAAMAAWELLRPGELFWGRVRRVLRHPAVLGFAAGTACFWLYGMTISPSVFWQDHVRTHLLDRVVHNNPLGYTNYPSVPGLWLEFSRHTGYVLLPLGLIALAMLAVRGRGRFQFSLPVIALWMLLIAVAFSLIDWRQTKHLMPLMLPLVMVPAAWAARSPVGRIVVGLALAGLVVWNLDALSALADHFDKFAITPAW